MLWGVGELCKPKPLFRNRNIKKLLTFNNMCAIIESSRGPQPRIQKGVIMWEAKAEYADGTSIERRFIFESNPHISDSDIQYELECWLLERHDECVWYSVNWIAED